MKKRVKKVMNQLGGYFNPFAVYTQTAQEKVRLAEPDKKTPIPCAESMADKPDFWI